MTEAEKLAISSVIDHLDEIEALSNWNLVVLPAQRTLPDVTSGMLLQVIRSLRDDLAWTERARSGLEAQVDDMRWNDPMETLRNEIASLKHELAEANAEIGHHHEDFRAISRIVRA